MNNEVSPNLAAQGISRQVEDRKLTLQMRNVTLQIEELIKNEENALTRILLDFSNLSNWIISQQGFLEANVRNSIIRECLRLKDNAIACIAMIDQITRWTRGERIAVERKLVLKVQLEEDFDSQERLVKTLEYKDDVVDLVRDIVGVVEKAKAEVTRDEDTEEQTERWLKDFRSNLENVRSKLEGMLKDLTDSSSTRAWQRDLEGLMKDIQSLLGEFARLDRLERLHLQMLLKIYEYEGQSLVKQAQLKGVREPEDLDFIQEDF